MLYVFFLQKCEQACNTMADIYGKISNESSSENMSALQQLANSIFAPLLPFALTYTQYAQSDLLARLNTVPLVSCLFCSLFKFDRSGINKIIG
jgi:hypothetical protein